MEDMWEGPPRRMKFTPDSLVAEAELEVDRLLYHLSEVFPHKMATTEEDE